MNATLKLDYVLDRWEIDFESKAAAVRWAAQHGFVSINDPDSKKRIAAKLNMTVQTVHATLKAAADGRKSLKRIKDPSDNPQWTPELKQKIIDKVQWCLDQATPVDHEQFPVPPMEWNLRGACAGKYKTDLFGLGTLCWHPVLAARNEEDYLRQVVPHEVAHYIVRQKWGNKLHGIKSHGPEWKFVMRGIFKLQPDRTHKYDVSGIKKSRSPYIYTCNCGKEFSVGIKRHQKIQNGVRYWCKSCKGTIRFVKKQ